MQICIYKYIHTHNFPLKDVLILSQKIRYRKRSLRGEKTRKKKEEVNKKRERKKVSCERALTLSRPWQISNLNTILHIIIIFIIPHFCILLLFSNNPFIFLHDSHPFFLENPSGYALLSTFLHPIYIEYNFRCVYMCVYVLGSFSCLMSM